MEIDVKGGGNLSLKDQQLLDRAKKAFESLNIFSGIDDKRVDLKQVLTAVIYSGNLTVDFVVKTEGVDDRAYLGPLSPTKVTEDLFVGDTVSSEFCNSLLRRLKTHRSSLKRIVPEKV